MLQRRCRNCTRAPTETNKEKQSQAVHTQACGVAADRAQRDLSICLDLPTFPTLKLLVASHRSGDPKVQKQSPRSPTGKWNSKPQSALVFCAAACQVGASAKRHFARALLHYSSNGTLLQLWLHFGQAQMWPCKPWHGLLLPTRIRMQYSRQQSPERAHGPRVCAFLANSPLRPFSLPREYVYVHVSALCVRMCVLHAGERVDGTASRSFARVSLASGRQRTPDHKAGQRWEGGRAGEGSRDATRAEFRERLSSVRECVQVFISPGGEQR